MSHKSLPIKVFKKGELEKIHEKPQLPPQPQIPQTMETVKKQAPQDFVKYLNVYNFKCELPGAGQTIDFKPLTVAHLKEIQTMDPGSEKKKDDPIFLSNVFDKIFESVIISEFDIENMYLNDRFTLILEIRKKTSGESYNWTLNCPKCKGQSIQIVDFNKMETKQAPAEINNVVKLSDQLSVYVDYLTRADEKRAHQYHESKHKGADINMIQRQIEISTLMVAASITKIISPDGEYEPSLEDSLYLIENIPQNLYTKIAQWQETNFFGPDMKINITCPHCDFKTTQEINSTDFFS